MVYEDSESRTDNVDLGLSAVIAGCGTISNLNLNQRIFDGGVEEAIDAGLIPGDLRGRVSFRHPWFGLGRTLFIEIEGERGRGVYPPTDDECAMGFDAEVTGYLTNRNQVLVGARVSTGLLGDSRLVGDLYYVR